MKDDLSRVSFDLPEELLEAISKEMKPMRSLDQVRLTYQPKVEARGIFSVGTALEDGYRNMARINLGMAEMGLGNDVCSLEDYESILRDEADESVY